MKITMQVEPASGDLAHVDYRWDTDTAILIANFDGNRQAAEGMSGSIEIAGKDGSWLILDVQSGRLGGVEVAVWPDVRHVTALTPPAEIEDVRLVVPARHQKSGVALLQMDATLLAESDQEETLIHFKVGTSRAARTVRVARDVLVDLGEAQTIKGIWLLNVPRFPDEQ